MNELEYEWLPLFFEKELKKKPLKKILLNNELVFVRLNNELVCFENICPHRNVPLDTGNIIDNNLQCNYHGWEFSNEGKLMFANRKFLKLFEYKSNSEIENEDILKFASPEDNRWYNKLKELIFNKDLHFEGL